MVAVNIAQRVELRMLAIILESFVELWGLPLPACRAILRCAFMPFIRFPCEAHQTEFANPPATHPDRNLDINMKEESNM